MLIQTQKRDKTQMQSNFSTILVFLMISLSKINNLKKKSRRKKRHQIKWIGLEISVTPQTKQKYKQTLQKSNLRIYLISEIFQSFKDPFVCPLVL